MEPRDIFLLVPSYKYFWITVMTTADQTQDEKQSEEVTELSLLKQRASMMGITFSNNIGLEKLRERIAEKLQEEDKSVENEEVKLSSGERVLVRKTKTLRQKLIDENMRLIRLRIANLDPKKKDLPGEILTVANEHLGTVKKYVPFGEVTENGYHVPYCIYKLLKSRKFLNIRNFKDKNSPTGFRTEQNWVSEYSLEVLPPLTQEELNKLAASQSAAGGIG